MEQKEYKRFKKLLISGVVCALFTMFGGEIPIGWVVYPEGHNEIVAMVLGSGDLSLLQLASGALFGGIFIPLQYYAFKAIADIIKKGGCTRCGKVVDAGAKAIGFFGGPVHVLCVGLMFVCKMANTQNLTEVPQSVWDYTLWLVLPITVVFMAIYMPMTVAMAIAVLKGKTIFPRWAVVFNPLTGKILLNAIGYIGPNTAFINGIRMSNMGIGSLLTFIGLLILLNQYYKKVSDTK